MDGREDKCLAVCRSTVNTQLLQQPAIVPGVSNKHIRMVGIAHHCEQPRILHPNGIATTIRRRALRRASLHHGDGDRQDYIYNKVSHMSFTCFPYAYGIRWFPDIRHRGMSQAASRRRQSGKGCLRWYSWHIREHRDLATASLRTPRQSMA